MDNSVVYFRVYFMGCLAVVLYKRGRQILQSVGDSRSPMVYLIVASLLNVVLDLVFVAVLGMGVGSAAFATIISQIVSALLAFRKLGRAAGAYAVRWREVRFDGPTLRAVVAQGLPSGVQNSVISLANVIVQANINAFGSQAMAGCAAYSKVEGFAFLPVTCFSMALATFVSQNVGAGQYDRVRKGMKFGILTSVTLAEVVGVLIFTLSPFLIGLFNDQPNVVVYGVRQAHTAALFYCLLAFSHCCAGILRGLGRPVVPMAIMLAVWCALRICYITVMGPADPGYRRHLLGLSAYLGGQRRAVRLVSGPRRAAQPRRRRAAAKAVRPDALTRFPPFSAQSTRPPAGYFGQFFVLSRKKRFNRPAVLWYNNK